MPPSEAKKRANKKYQAKTIASLACRVKKEQVRRRIERLAGSKVNDAVRLAFLDAKGLKELGKMDLSAVAEFKRSSAGTVEIKFVDRLEALKWLAETEEGPREGGIIEALEKSAEELKEA